jgi:hypothetical protein
LYYLSFSWPLYCFLFLLTIVLSVVLPRERENNTMAKRKTDNTMTKRKGKQYKITMITLHTLNTIETICNKSVVSVL